MATLKCHTELTCHLQEDSLCNADSCCQCSLNDGNMPGYHCGNQGGSTHSSNNLSREQHQATHRRKSTSENQTKSDGRIKEPYEKSHQQKTPNPSHKLERDNSTSHTSTNTIKRPSGNKQRKSISQAHINDLLITRTRHAAKTRLRGRGHGVAEEGEVQEHESADEFARGGDEVVSGGGSLYGWFWSSLSAAGPAASLRRLLAHCRHWCLFGRWMMTRFGVISFRGR